MANSLHLQRQDSSKKLHIYIKPKNRSQIWLETKTNLPFEQTLNGDLSTQKRYLVVRTNQPVMQEWFTFKGNSQYAKVHLGLMIESKGPTYTEISCSVDRLFYSQFVIEVLHDHHLIKIARKLEKYAPGDYPLFIQPYGWQKLYNIIQLSKTFIYHLLTRKKN